jgi:hypothetical protein
VVPTILCASVRFVTWEIKCSGRGMNCIFVDGIDELY